MTFPPIQNYVLSHIKKSNADLTESTSSNVSYVSYCSRVSYQYVSKGCVTGTLPSAACFYEVRSRPERPGDTTRHAQLSAGWFTTMEEKTDVWDDEIIPLTCSFPFGFSISSFQKKILVQHHQILLFFHLFIYTESKLRLYFLQLYHSLKVSNLVHDFTHNSPKFMYWGNRISTQL